ncbi:MAG: hypothetical protein L6405_08085 [Actinomycetia bacterium]|nr:hypothetical protein [Actinomycetes bacterium]
MENFLSRLHFNKKILLELLILVILLGLIVFIVFKYYRSKIITTEKPVEQTAEQQPTPTPTPSPISLPPGKGTYNVSQGKHQGPSISQVSFDPLDVRSGQKLTIIVKATDTAPVTSVTAVLQLDQTQKDLVFKLINGDALSGDWQTSIKIEDTLWYRYILTITSVSTSGSNQTIVAPRS